jgi:hypothetical protein
MNRRRSYIAIVVMAGAISLVVLAIWRPSDDGAGRKPWGDESLQELQQSIVEGLHGPASVARIESTFQEGDRAPDTTYYWIEGDTGAIRSGSAMPDDDGFALHSVTVGILVGLFRGISRTRFTHVRWLRAPCSRCTSNAVPPSTMLTLVSGRTITMVAA